MISSLFIFLSPAIAAATLAYALMLMGFFLRKKSPLWHMRAMFAAIAIDLALVAILQAQKNVIKTAIGPTLEWPQRLHIACSLGATLCYLPLLYLGYRMWRGPEPRLRPYHKRVGIVAFCLRTLGFITMFTMLNLAA